MAEETGSSSSSGPPAKRFKRDYNDTITVLVGAEEERFIVHKEAICAESPFFAAACSKGWSEGQEGIVRLPAHDAESFHSFLHWVYAKEVDIPMLEGRGKTFPFPSWSSMGKLWALAHYLDHHRLRDAVIDAMLHKMEDNPRLSISAACLSQIFEMTPENSTIQRLLLEWHAVTRTIKELTDQGHELPRVAVMHMAKMFAKGCQRLSYPRPSLEQRCEYHDHAPGMEGCWDENK